jgi:hypothetical protein
MAHQLSLSRLSRYYHGFQRGMFKTINRQSNTKGKLFRGFLARVDAGPGLPETVASPV